MTQIMFWFKKPDIFQYPNFPCGPASQILEAGPLREFASGLCSKFFMAFDDTSIPRRCARALFALGILGVTGISLMPLRAVAEIGISDKLLHMAAYGALAMCGAFGYAKGKSPLLIGAGLIGLGTCLEVLQNFVPGRTMSLGDIVANVAGVGLGLAVVHFSDTA